MTLARLAIAFAISSLVSAWLVAVVRRWAERNSVLDHPTHRSSHARPTPRGGGIAIVAVTAIGTLLLQATQPVTSWQECSVFLIASCFIAAVSWIDDIRHLSPLLRLAVHFGAAVAAVIFIGGWSRVWLPYAGVVELGVAGAILTVVWIAGLTNAYNFMDGIDGIAGLQAVAAGAGWTYLAFRESLPLVASISVLIAASSLGFLVHNWSPARIFMGDVGSAFLGYCFAVLAVIASKNDPHLAFAGVLLVWPFVYDSGYTLIRRAMRGERLHEAHRTHLYQRLNQTGVTHATVSLLYFGLALLGVAAAIVPAAVVSIPIAAALLTAVVIQRERSVRSQTEHRPAQTQGEPESTRP